MNLFPVGSCQSCSLQPGCKPSRANTSQPQRRSLTSSCTSCLSLRTCASLVRALSEALRGQQYVHIVQSECMDCRGVQQHQLPSQGIRLPGICNRTRGLCSNIPPYAGCPLLMRLRSPVCFRLQHSGCFLAANWCLRSCTLCLL